MIDAKLLEQREVVSHASSSLHGQHLPARQLLISLFTIGTLFVTGAPVDAAELFPYSPPSVTQQRPMAQRPSITPELSSEERGRLEDLSAQAKKLSPAEQQQLKGVLRKSLESAEKARNSAQVQYYREALRQLQ